MATVTKKFRDDFETWATNRITSGDWTEDEMTSFKDMLRRDLAPGPDQLRTGLTVIIAAGLRIPATIDDHEERYCLWANYFNAEAEEFRQQVGELKS